MAKITPVDCNTCQHLHMTEAQQQRAYRVTKTHPHHICRKHNCAVFHHTNKKDHDPRLLPCLKCNPSHDHKPRMTGVEPHMTVIDDPMGGE